MKVLVVGSGGREHTLAWKIKKSRWVSNVYVAPGNDGMRDVAKLVDISATDIEGLANFARENGIDLTVVGPEVPLEMGMVDHFERNGLRVFGPTKKAAMLETSKIYAKEIMRRYHVPTASFRIFEDPDEARRYVEEVGGPQVVKVDGLAAGKGAFPCEDEMEALEAIDLISSGAFGKAGDRILIEDYLKGEEASILAFCDGKTVVPLESAQDHKRAFDNDKGPNTGGMGAYSPAPVVSEDMASSVYDEIFLPMIEGMRKEGHPYKGILYAGLMITEKGPKVIEFNCRFGDPEAQVVIPRMATDIIKPLIACCDGTLDRVKFRWSKSKAVCVVLASGGYPGKYAKGLKISGLEKVETLENIVVFHSGTRIDEDEDVVTNGGRVLGVTAMDGDLQTAIRMAYKAVGKIRFQNRHYRKDIGKKALLHLDDL